MATQPQAWIPHRRNRPHFLNEQGPLNASPTEPGCFPSLPAPGLCPQTKGSQEPMGKGCLAPCHHPSLSVLCSVGQPGARPCCWPFPFSCLNCLIFFSGLAQWIATDMLQILNILIAGLGGLGVWLPAVKTANLLLKLQKTSCLEIEKYK